MKQRRAAESQGTMLELWRPPKGAGEPVGCLTTTYTFHPGMFDEQCLARFLQIDSEPNREDLAFLLERERRLEHVYAGVMVDHSQAGVEHSLRWSVLPVRVQRGIQHAKISLLAWSEHIRVIVASANMTEPGYRSNFEVAGSVDMTRHAIDRAVLDQSIEFLRALLVLVPGASLEQPHVMGARAFLGEVEHLSRNWEPIRSRSSIRRQLVCTLPKASQQEARSSLAEAFVACRNRGPSAAEAWVASPFFDADDESGRVVAALCKLMARGKTRKLSLCVPAVSSEEKPRVPRLAAPKALWLTPQEYQTDVVIEILPEIDGDKNVRRWHAKMMALRAAKYTALLVGSSNFTSAGMGVGHFLNTEANLLTIVDSGGNSREPGHLEAIWPHMTTVGDPEAAEWLGAQPDLDEEQGATQPAAPAGFVSAIYVAGDQRSIRLTLAPAELPAAWQVLACGAGEQEILELEQWQGLGSPVLVVVPWAAVHPPVKLLVRWDSENVRYEAFIPLNVDDGSKLPPPSGFENMSADDMLEILAASDPGAAYRKWARWQTSQNEFDPDLDSAVPDDLNPLTRYDLHKTFLHRVRRRARVLASLRANLQRPAGSKRAVEVRLTGLIGVKALADRLVSELSRDSERPEESLLTLADFLIVLREVRYEPDETSVSAAQFEAVFRPFLRELAMQVGAGVRERVGGISGDVVQFWERVVERCQS